jgi:16S rRNA (cytidine1402-2'-O)-methyltransferase
LASAKQGAKRSYPKNPERRNQDSGILYVVATPIGNLEDVTLRSLSVLRNAALIAAENVTHTRAFCRHFDIKKRLVAYNQHNRNRREPELINRLRSGECVALVTDAGTPGISDPGVHLIARAAREGITVRPIPGPSAAIAALSVSGLPTDRFVFQGFLSNKPGKRRKELKRLVSEPRTVVFFEAPHRVRAMLTDLQAIWGDREMVMARELTKVFEEVKRGTVSSVLEHLSAGETRGEFTLVVAGSGEEEAESLEKGEVEVKIQKFLTDKKMSLKDIARRVSAEEGLSFREVYRVCLARKRALENAGGPDVG